MSKHCGDGSVIEEVSYTSDNTKIDLDLGDLKKPEGNVFVVLGRIHEAMKLLGLEDEFKKEFDPSKLDSYTEVFVKASKYFNIIAKNLPENFKKACEDFPVTKLMKNMGYL